MNQFHFPPERSSIEKINSPAAEPSAPSPIVSAVHPLQPAPESVQPTPPAEPAQPAPNQPTPPPTTAKKKSNGLWITLAIIGTCFALLLGAFAIYAAKYAIDAFDLPLPTDTAKPSDVVSNIPQSTTPTFNYREDVTEDDKLTPQEIIKKVSPSVVTVHVTIQSGMSETSGGGTGVIYTDNGYILTNAHVVEDATSVYVTDYNGTEYPATIIGMDSQSDTAVIKIDATDLSAAEFGSSSALVPGDLVIAIGTPYSEILEYTATQGIVSALRNDMYLSGMNYTLDLIQHDAAINAGNSGGPLINEYGQIIGINTIKISGTFENLGFALQIDSVLPLIAEIMNTGKVTRPGIGITCYTAEDESGVVIESVTENGPAGKAGLQKGDIIIKINDLDTPTINDLKGYLTDCKIGQTVTITYLRAGQQKTAELVLEELKP